MAPTVYTTPPAMIRTKIRVERIEKHSRSITSNIQPIIKYTPSSKRSKRRG